MSAYYNENGAFASSWLRTLIAAGLIAPGDVDTRDIRDVRPIDLKPYTQHHFFAGIGGWSLALRNAAWPDHRPVWTGSCPCQPFSAAGRRGGFADERHLWPSWHWLIEQCRPAIVFGEQVASAAQWLSLVRGDLEALGYAVGAIPVEAASAGADHLRDRYWFVAHNEHAREGRRGLFGPGKSNEAVAERASSEFAGSSSDGVARSFVGNDTRQRRGEGRPKHELWSGRNATSKSSGAVARSVPDGLPGGIQAPPNINPEGRQTSLGDFGGVLGASAITQADRIIMANTHFAERRFGDEQPAWQLAQQQRHQEARAGFDYEWAIGADRKARRIKPGIRLLADGFPSRVGLLRGFGNAIDPRPAAAFIIAISSIAAPERAWLPRP